MCKILILNIDSVVECGSRRSTRRSLLLTQLYYRVYRFSDSTLITVCNLLPNGTKLIVFYVFNDYVELNILRY